MKKLLWVLFMAAPFMAFAQKQTNFEIRGKLDSIDVPMVYIVHGQGYTRIIDSARVNNHAYNLKGYVQVGQQTMLMTYNMSTSKEFHADGLALIFLSPGKSIVRHGKEFRNVTVTGSAGYSDYKALITIAKPYEQKNEALKTRTYQLLKQNDTLEANNTSAEQIVFEQRFMDNVYGSFIKQHPQSPAAFFALQKLAGTGHNVDGPKLKPYFDLLPESVKEAKMESCLKRS
ncbi:hypothetical protein MTO98_13855 [Mucilaginibacter sp. SMC90]|uniref:hypothetical protein n=1 Tax=Mucilaginibacter sp. SMC90 TaxID=2929803 RepID=UPI001FB46C34|nr:hypothetical protein [Mucilaginibacter sp. SMC90]UOE52165.1 hypothetical protein MTO98_13855 [Mucilaginibacter sp. SMC90]